MTNWYTIQHDGWKLPATEEPHYWCGIRKTEGCLNEIEHEQLGYGKRVYVKQYQLSCYRPVCKTCFKKWIARQADRATKRIEKYSKLSHRKPIHLLLSVPSSQHDLPVKELRIRVKNILKEINIVGAAVIFHPFRFDKRRRLFYFAPHFHMLGFGYIQGISEAFAKYGWFVKYLGVRESVFQSFYYLLSHCGIRKGFHALTWLGSLSYSKLKLEKEPDYTKCHICGRKFIEIYHDGVHPVVPPGKAFQGLVDSGDWHQVETMPESEWTKQDRYEYALEKELYVANKGIELVLT